MAAKAFQDARDLEQAHTLLQLSLGRLSGGSCHSNRNKRSSVFVKRRWRQKMEQCELSASSRPSQQPSSPQRPRFQTKAVIAVSSSPELPSPMSLQLARLDVAMKRTRESRKCVMMQCLARLAEFMKRSVESRRGVMLQRELLFTTEPQRQLAGTRVDLPFRRRQVKAVYPEKASESKSSSGKSPKRGKGSKREASSIDKLMEQVTEKKMTQLDKKEKAAASGDDHIAKKIKLAKQFNTMTVSLSGNKLLAAKIVPEFKIFLSTAERQEVETTD